MSKRVLITGVTGFVGKRLVLNLLKSTDYEIVVASRNHVDWLSPAVRQIRINGIDASTDWSYALEGVDVVIHLAARAHVMRETEDDPWAQYYSVNAYGSMNLSKQASAAGVRRFVFVSSIKVNGEMTLHGKPFSTDDKPCPSDPYALSKYEAENGLLRLMKETKMEVVIVRPPMVYGPGVKANFLSMIKWVQVGVPFPLGAVRNRRTLIALDNLVDLLGICVEHPAAANQILLAGDNEDLSTIDLLKRTGTALGCSVRLFSVPVWMLLALAALTGKRQAMQRLCGSLQIDISKTMNLLNWEPPVGVDEALKQTADYFRDNQY